MGFEFGKNLWPIAFLGVLSCAAYALWEIGGSPGLAESLHPNWSLYLATDTVLLIYGFCFFRRQSARFTCRVYAWLGWAMIADVLMESYLVPVYHNSPRSNLLCVAGFLLVGLLVAAGERALGRAGN